MIDDEIQKTKRILFEGEDKREVNDVRLDDMEQNTKDIVTLIKKTDERIRDQAKKTLELEFNFSQKIKKIEQEVVEKLQELGKTEGSFTYNFTAHEESIQTMHDQIIAIEKDMLDLKEKTTESSQKAIEICSETRYDYVGRMEQIYDDH